MWRMARCQGPPKAHSHPLHQLLLNNQTFFSCNRVDATCFQRRISEVGYKMYNIADSLKILQIIKLPSKLLYAPSPKGSHHLLWLFRKHVLHTVGRIVMSNFCSKLYRAHGLTAPYTCVFTLAYLTQAQNIKLQELDARNIDLDCSTWSSRKYLPLVILAKMKHRVSSPRQNLSSLFLRISPPCSNHCDLAKQGKVYPTSSFAQ